MSKSHRPSLKNFGMRKISEYEEIGISDIGLFCSLACIIPWSSFFVVPEPEPNLDTSEPSIDIMRSTSCDEFEEPASYSPTSVETFFELIPIGGKSE